MTAPAHTFQKLGTELDFQKELILGDSVRDWHIQSGQIAFHPYNKEKDLVETSKIERHLKRLWPLRSELGNRKTFSRGTYFSDGRPWYEWHQIPKDIEAGVPSITFAFVSTHNHFVLDQTGRAFNRSAPMIKLPKGATIDEHLALLGLLNSSAACFWLKQVSHDKGSQSGTGGFMHDEWERFFEFTGTKIQEFPVPSEQPLELSKLLDSLAYRLSQSMPSNVCKNILPTRILLDKAHSEYRTVLSQMIALQEELDWQCYGLYGLLSPNDVAQTTSRNPESTQAHLGERAFEIVLARKVAAGQTETVWFSRHGSSPSVELPEAWTDEYATTVQARIDLIGRQDDIALLERPEYKRRWAVESWEAMERIALTEWILDRCEQVDLWFFRREGLRYPRLLTVSELADQFRDDEDMHTVAQLFASDHLGKRDLALTKILGEALKDEHVPYLAALRYKDSGLRKRAEWEKGWELQRQEDREDRKLDIPVPPKYVTGDFRTFAYWSHRGKLDVPKERFISYIGAARHSDDALLIGWAGWDHKDQGQALVNLINERVDEDQWESERIVPLLAGLVEVMPWVRQWHGEYDAEWEGTPAEEFQTFLESQLGRHEVSEEAVKAWRPSKEFLKGAKG